jgi:hypothetical protein
MAYVCKFGEGLKWPTIHGKDRGGLCMGGIMPVCGYKWIEMVI